MLKLLLISKNQDFYGAKFPSTETSGVVTVVAPNPQIADQCRKSFENAEQQVNSITISKFIQEELASLIDEGELQNFRGKSELNLLLGAIWRRTGNAGDFVSFKKAFNLLTELRSFSMSEQVFEAVLEHYDPDIAQSVFLMHRVLEDMGIIDEHKSYFLLSERLRAGDLPPEKNFERTIIFYGFDYMTASQVDLLKSIALRDDVIIPIYKSAFERSNPTDWIRWFDEYNLEVKDLSKIRKNKNTLNYQVFSKGYFAKVLRDKVDFKYCVLGTKTLTPEFIQEVSLENSAFKVGVDIFASEMSELKDELSHFIVSNQDIDSLKDFLQKQARQWIEKKQYRKLKSCLLIIGKLNEWEALSSDNSIIDIFELEIIFESALLDAPRVNFTTLTLSHDHFIRSLGNIDEVKDQRSILGIHSLHQAIKGINANYSEGVEKYLASIGPIRGADFEVNIFKERLKEFVEDNDVLLLIESGILEHDTHWSSVLSEFELIEKSVHTSSLAQTTHLSFPKNEYKLESISASKLQRYYDCPQKFYFQYAERLLPRIEFEDELIPMELGNLQHKIIEFYFKRFESFNDINHDELIHEVLNVSLKSVTVTKELAQEYFVELKSYTKDIIIKIFEIKERYGLEVTFEFPFSANNEGVKFSGSIDCYLSNAEMFIVLDFKRSNSVFQSFTGILEFDQLQLWFYLKRLIEMEKFTQDDNLSLGYINLSELKSSMVFTSEKDNIDLFKKEMDISKVKHVPNLAEVLETYSEIEREILAALKDDREFLPNPRKPQVCLYCDLKNICSRGNSGKS